MTEITRDEQRRQGLSDLSGGARAARAEEVRRLFRNGYFIEQSHRSILDVSADAPPAWMSREVQDALNEISHGEVRKKRTTIIRLAEAEANGTSKRSVFASKDCCSTGTWYGRTPLPGQPERRGWQDDPVIAHALEVCRTRAHWYYDQLEEERLRMRRDVLAQTQDRLIEISPAAVDVLFDVMLEADTDDVRRKAAVDALTHASVETAPKSESMSGVDLRVDGPGVSMRDIRNRSRNLAGRPPDPDEDVIEGEIVEREGAPPPAPGGLRIPMTAVPEPPELGNNNGDGEVGEGEELGD